MDELLRYRHEIQRRRGTGSSPSTPHSHVLLEAVAHDEKAGRGADETRCQRAPRCIGWNEQEGLLASCKDRGHERRPVECISQKAGAYFYQNTVDQGLLSGYGPIISANRPVRTRMPGGVGAGGENPPATRLESSLSISEIYLVLFYIS